MPANKKNTSKTAHVLNVITAGKDTADPEIPAPTPADPGSAPMVASAIMGTAVPVLEVEHSSDDLSSQVREALNAELAEAVSTPSEEQINEVPMADSALSAQPSPVFQTVPPAAQAAPTEQPLPVTRPASIQQSQPWDPDDSQYINIMQALVEEKTPKYIKLLGVCSCSRCLADVKALALSHLDPKYIVVRKNQNLPITVYDNHYNAAVTSQIISACRTVTANPRH